MGEKPRETGLASMGGFATDLLCDLKQFFSSFDYTSRKEDELVSHYIEML